MKEIDEMAKYVRKLLDGMRIDVDLQNRNNIFKIVFKENLSIALSNDLGEPYNKFLKFLKKKAVAKGKTISDKKIDDLFINFLIKLHHRKTYAVVISNVHKEITILVQELTNLALHQYLIIVPLTNLKIEKEFKIGHVELAELTKDKLEKLSAKYNVDPIISNKDTLDKIIDEVKGHSNYPTVAVVQVEANDAAEANTIALRITDQALNILRFYLKPSPYVDFMISGEEPWEVMRTILIFDLTDKSKSRQGEICNMHDPENNNVIDDKWISSVKDVQFDLINNLITLPDHSISPLQGDILSAIYWIGNAFKETDVTDKFIKLMICLDVLLAQGRQDKSEIIAKRYTSIVNSNSSDQVQIESYCKIRNWYSIRNKVMHSGLKFISEDLANEAKFAVGQLVYELIGYSTEYVTIGQLHKEVLPINEKLFKAVNCENN